MLKMRVIAVNDQIISNYELADTTLESIQSSDPLYTSQLHRLSKLGNQDLGYLSTTVGLNEAGFFNLPPENLGDDMSEIPIIEPRILKSGLEKTLKRRISMNTLKFDQLEISEYQSNSPPPVPPSSPLIDLMYNKEIFQNEQIYSPMHSNKSSEQLKSCLKLNYSSSLSVKVVKFNQKCRVAETWNDNEYDRKNPDMKRVSVMVTYYPRELIPIRKEINELKKEMKIHPASIQNTHYLKV